MKTFLLVRTLSLAILLGLTSFAVAAREYHVVIGAFADESNAKRFTATVRAFFQNAHYYYHESRHLYYVTVMRTLEKEEAQKMTRYLRVEKGFSDAWVLEQPASHDSAPVLANASKEPAKPSTVAFFSASERAPERSGSTSTVSATNDVAWTTSDALSYIRNPEQLGLQALDLAPSANLFTFKVEDELGNPLPSEVMLVDFAKIKKIESFQPGETVAIKGTKREQMVTFVCDRLGYQQTTRIFNLDHLSRSPDIWRNPEGVWEVRIRLKPLQEHDIAPMNKTLFYKDAAVLDASSRGELDALVAWLNDNLGYKIVLHGHCNPGTRREILLPDADHNYFDLDGTIGKNGSDKLLTKRRAETVRKYLVENGIDKKRISIVAWGSMEPVVNPRSKDAHVNERIEIELVK